jgi:hypothetical protein
LRWTAMRWAKFFAQWGKGALRSMMAKPATAHEDTEGEAPRLARSTSMRE